MLFRSAVTSALATCVVVGCSFFLLSSLEPKGRDIALGPDPTRFYAVVTAYSSSPDETWGDPFVTASGRRVADGVLACPRRLPFGTRVRINQRVYTCWDRLHPKYDDRFDVWKPSKEAALEFGRRQVIVQIL